MSAILRWIVGVGFLWFLAALGLTAYLTKIQSGPQEPGSSNQVIATVLIKVIDWGAQLGHFIAPVLQLALIVMILIAAAERFGFTKETRAWTGFAALSATNNVQAFIAVTIISALVVGVLGGVDRVDVLKDLALVVLGFYFGTRRRQGEVEEEVAAQLASSGEQSSALASDTSPPRAAPQA